MAERPKGAASQVAVYTILALKSSSNSNRSFERRIYDEKFSVEPAVRAWSRLKLVYYMYNCITTAVKCSRGTWRARKVVGCRWLVRFTNCRVLTTEWMGMPLAYLTHILPLVKLPTKDSTRNPCFCFRACATRLHSRSREVESRVPSLELRVPISTGSVFKDRIACWLSGTVRVPII